MVIILMGISINLLQEINHYFDHNYVVVLVSRPLTIKFSSASDVII